MTRPRRSCSVTVGLDLATRDALRWLACRHDRSVSDMARVILTERLEQEPGGPGHVIPFPGRAVVPPEAPEPA